jgi:ATP-dependent Clp protease ATP-binding subunit ClpA
MFERFTDRARRAIVLSQEEARRLHHNYIGTEHVLLGLLGEQQGVAARVLDGFEMSASSVRAEVVELVGEGQHDVPGHIPFTPRAKKTLELALRESLQLNHNYIGTEHILLGLIREGDGVAAKIMRNHGDLPAIRTAVINMVPAWSKGPSRLAAQLRTSGEQPGEFALEPEPTGTPATDAALAEAARLAGPQQVGSHHLLLAALADPTSAAARAMASLGIDLDQAKEALRDVDVTGTSDEAPEEAGRRQMNIEVTDEVVTVVAVDPAIVEVAKAAALALATRGEGGQTDVPGGVIRGADLRGAAAVSLATVWQALRESLVEISHAAPTPEKTTERATTEKAAEKDEPETGAA